MRKQFNRAVGVLLIALFAVMPAFATPTAITAQQLKLNNYAVQAGDLTITMTAMDSGNGNSYVATGQEVVIFQNTDSSSHTVTITSVADQLGRTDTSLTNYSIAGTTIVAIQMKNLVGWIQSGQTVNMTTSSNLVKIAVVRYQ